MAYKNNRPDSNRGRVYTALTTQGKDAAIALARELGVADRALKFWFEKVFKHEEKAVIPTKKHLATKGRRVYHIGWPDMPGTVTNEGKQQSVVRWDSGFEYVANN